MKRRVPGQKDEAGGEREEERGRRSGGCPEERRGERRGQEGEGRADRIDNRTGARG